MPFIPSGYNPAEKQWAVNMDGDDVRRTKLWNGSFQVKVAAFYHEPAKGYSARLGDLAHCFGYTEIVLVTADEAVMGETVQQLLDRCRYKRDYTEYTHAYMTSGKVWAEDGTRGYTYWELFGELINLHADPANNIPDKFSGWLSWGRA